MKKTLIVLSLLVLVVGLNGVALAQSQSTQADFNFFQDFSGGQTLNKSVSDKIVKSAQKYYEKHNVEFYTIILPSGENAGFDQAVSQIVNSWEQSKLQNKTVNLFLVKPQTQEYKLYVDQNLRQKLSYFMIDKIITENITNVSDVNVAFEKTVPRLIDYFVLATNATVGKSQFEIKQNEIKENPNIRLYSKNNYVKNTTEQEQNNVQEESEQAEESSGFPLLTILFVGFGIVLVGGVAYFIVQRRNEDEEEYYDEYEVEEVEEEEYYPE
jgi:hypothetical protein